MENKQELLLQCYNLTRLAGLVNSQVDFANFVGVSKQTMSNALNARDGYLTDKLLNKVITTLADHNIDISGNNNGTIQQANGNHNTQTITTAPPAPAKDTYTPALLDELKAQRELLSDQLKAKDEQINSLTRQLQNLTDLIVKSIAPLTNKLTLLLLLCCINFAACKKEPLTLYELNNQHGKELVKQNGQCLIDRYSALTDVPFTQIKYNGYSENTNDYCLLLYTDKITHEQFDEYKEKLKAYKIQSRYTKNNKLEASIITYSLTCK